MFGKLKNGDYFRSIIQKRDLSDLTTDQAHAIEEIHKFLCDDDSTYFILKGVAGSGKTFTINRLLETLNFVYEKNLILTATTNKATKNLNKMTGGGYICKTVHSALGLRLLPNGGVKEVNKKENIKSEKMIELMVVDEYTMTNSLLLEYINESAFKYNYKVLFVGDSYQAPPVNEDFSPVDEINCKSVMLSKIVRQAEGSGIIQTASSVRGLIDDSCDELILPDSKEIMIVDTNTFNEVVSNAFPTDDVDDIRVLAWTNRRVDAYNNMIRSAVYGKSEASENQFMVGERCVLAEPVVSQDRVVLTTDTEVVIKSVSVAEDVNGILCNFVTCTVIDGKQIPYELKIVHKDGMIKYREKLNELTVAAKQDRRKWFWFWKFKEGYHDLRYCSAITVHRSQGSTFKNVFIDVGDILSNRKTKDALRLLYVAVTRASDFVMLREWGG